MPHLLVALLLLAWPAALRGQDAPRRHLVLVGTGPADRTGLVGHLGWLTRPAARVPVAVRLDGLMGRHDGARVGAVAAGLEVAPRLAAPRQAAASTGLFLHLVVGPAYTWSGPSRNLGGMLGIGARVGLRSVTLSAEQRFQQDFSPLLVGIAIAP